MSFFPLFHDDETNDLRSLGIWCGAIECNYGKSPLMTFPSHSVQ